MKLRLGSRLAAFGALALLAGCDSTSPVNLPHLAADDVAAQFDAAHAAKKPVDEQAARQAAIHYFAENWGIPQNAAYAFNPLVNAAVVDNSIAVPKTQIHESGWFACGVVTTPGTGGAGSGLARPFYAQFDPQSPETVRKGAVETVAYDYDSVASLCREIYGLAYLPQYQALDVGEEPRYRQ